MESPLSRTDLDIYVHGTHLVMTTHYRQGQFLWPRIRTFDFGRRGCSILTLRDESGGSGERWGFFYKSGFGCEAAGVWGKVGSLSDGSFFQVSCFSYSVTALLWTEVF